MTAKTIMDTNTYQDSIQKSNALIRTSKDLEALRKAAMMIQLSRLHLESISELGDETKRLYRLLEGSIKAAIGQTEKGVK